MDKQIKEELTKIYEQIGALLSTDESDKIKKFGTLQILGAAVPAPEKPYRKGDVLGYNGTDFDIGDTVTGKEITWLKLGDIWVCDRNILQGISWETLNKKGFVFGKEIEIDNEKYTLRILTGSDGEDYGKGCGNEWDHLADEYDEDNDILHFDNMYSWCQETYYDNPVVMAIEEKDGTVLYRGYKGCFDYKEDQKALQKREVARFHLRAEGTRRTNEKDRYTITELNSGIYNYADLHIALVYVYVLA